MKSLIYAILPLTVVLILANSSGPGLVQKEDLTGSPLGVSTCAKCHSGGTFGTETIIEVIDGDNPVMEYIPGQTYTLRVKVEGTGVDKYGFQLVALESTNDNAGDYGTAASGTRVLKINGKDYFEQSSPSTSGLFEIEWSAPASSTGDVTFYATGNAVDGNGGTGGDMPASSSLTITEGGVSGLNQLEDLLSFRLFPNPASDFVNLKLQTEEVEIMALRLMDLNGRIYENLYQPESDLSIYIGDVPSGVYITQVVTNRGIINKKWLKI